MKIESAIKLVNLLVIDGESITHAVEIIEDLTGPLNPDDKIDVEREISRRQHTRYQLILPTRSGDPIVIGASTAGMAAMIAGGVETDNPIPEDRFSQASQDDVELVTWSSTIVDRYDRVLRDIDILTRHGYVWIAK